MADLDGKAVDAVAERVLQPARLAKLLDSYPAASAGADADRQGRIARLKGELTEAAGAKSRLLKLATNGLLGEDDPELAAQLRKVEERRLRVRQALTVLETQTRAGHAKAITPARIERIATAIRQGVMTGETQVRRAWLRLFVGNVTVSPDEIRISGPTEALAQLAAAGSVDALPALSSQLHRKWRGERNQERTLSGKWAVRPVSLVPRDTMRAATGCSGRQETWTSVSVPASVGPFWSEAQVGQRTLYHRSRF